MFVKCIFARLVITTPSDGFLVFKELIATNDNLSDEVYTHCFAKFYLAFCMRLCAN